MEESFRGLEDEGKSPGNLPSYDLIFINQAHHQKSVDFLLER